jgi:hypothetical protein
MSESALLCVISDTGRGRPKKLSSRMFRLMYIRHGFDHLHSHSLFLSSSVSLISPRRGVTASATSPSTTLDAQVRATVSAYRVLSVHLHLYLYLHLKLDLHFELAARTYSVGSAFSQRCYHHFSHVRSSYHSHARSAHHVQYIAA